MKRFAVCIGLILATNFVCAQTAKPVAKPVVKKAAVVSANDELIALAKLGMPEEILLAKVSETKAAGIKYNTSAEAIGKLQAEGVNQKVIAAIFGITAPISVPAPAAPSVTVVMPAQQHVGVSLDQPSTQSVEGREAGIYFDDGSKQVMLEPNGFTSAKIGGLNRFASIATYGIVSSKLKASVRSSKAMMRLQTRTPVFYFYFENKGSGLSNTGGTSVSGMMLGASSPNEFILGKFDVSKNDRSLIMMEAGLLAGESSGTSNKQFVEIEFRRLAPGVYEVKSKSPMDPGEYCFYYGGGMTAVTKAQTGKLFDFGIDPGASVQ